MLAGSFDLPTTFYFICILYIYLQHLKVRRFTKLRGLHVEVTQLIFTIEQFLYYSFKFFQ